MKYSLWEILPDSNVIAGFTENYFRSMHFGDSVLKENGSRLLRFLLDTLLQDMSSPE